MAVNGFAAAQDIVDINEGVTALAQAMGTRVGQAEDAIAEVTDSIAGIPGELTTLTNAVNARPTSVDLAAEDGADLVSTSRVEGQAVTRAVRDKLQDIYDARDWGAVQNGTDQTAIIQKIVDDLADKPLAEVYVPHGVKCAYNQLDYENNTLINFSYYRDDELNQPGLTGLGSGERVNLRVTSRFPDDETGGYVGEEGIDAPLHAALVANTRYDMITGGLWGVGPGQSLTDVVRTSIALNQGNRGVHHITTHNFSIPAGIVFRATTYKNFRDIYKLPGLGTAGWTVAPAVGARVYSDNGFVGLVTAIDATDLYIRWVIFRPEIGQVVQHDGGTATGPITSVVIHEHKEMSALGQSLDSGHWSISVRYGDNKDLLGIGGDIGFYRTQTFSQYHQKPVQWPGPVWRHPADPLTGTSLRQISSLPPSRLFAFDGPEETSNSTGLVGACAAHTAFTQPLEGSIPYSSTHNNIASIVDGGVGIYNITFARPLRSVDYVVVPSVDAFYSRGLQAGATFKTAEGFSLRVWNAGTGALTDLPTHGSVEFVVIGGDLSI